MSRRAHYLKAIKGGTLPASIVCVATAGDSEANLEWAWRTWYADGAEFGDGEGTSGKGSRSFWLSLAAHCRIVRGSWVVMMNAVHELTRLGFWELLEEKTWRLTGHDEKESGQGQDESRKRGGGVCVIESPPTIIQATGPRGLSSVQIVDARNYGVKGWPSILATGHHESDARKAVAEKAESLWQFVNGLTGLVKKHRLGSLKSTAASQAMHAYRYRFLRSQILCHDNLPAIGLERAAMYAGRNEAWTIGRTPGMVWHLDFNSFYPAVTVGAGMPARLVGYRLDCQRDPRDLMNAGYLCIAEVTLETELPRFPVRFSRNRHARASMPSDGTYSGLRCRDGDTVYPVGTFSTALCGPELSLAYAAGSVRRVHSVAWYEPSELFTQWACELAIAEDEARQLPTTALREVVKRLRNSLYGKFGQWHWQWQPAPEAGAKLPYDTWWDSPGKGEPLVRYRSIGHRVEREELRGESPESCPAIAAWVYSLARARLWQAIECAGLCNVHYMDSDSLWVTHDGFKILELDGWLHETLPGKLKVAGMHERVAFHGLKHYTADGRNVQAGVPGSAEGNYVDGWEFDTPETMRQALCLKRAPEDRTVRHSVRPSGVYRHGIVTVRGRVIPYTFNEQ